MSQDPSHILEREFERFIEFGNFLDRRTRRYLVEYFKHRLAGDIYELPDLNDQYFQYFRSALDHIFGIDGLLTIARSNEKITQFIVLDVLHWLRKTSDKVQKKHPFQKEVQRLEGWAVTPFHVFKTRYPFLLQFVASHYPPEEIQTRFYKKKYETYFEEKQGELTEQEREEFDLITNDLLSQWDARLQGRILEFQLKKFKEEEENYLELLESKVNEYQKLYSIISPFTDYLAWDLSRELWEDSSFDILKKYDDLLQDEQSIRELADMLGDMREAEIEMEEETFEKTIIRQEWKVDEEAKSEIVGIHESNDLNTLVSSEVGLLSDPQTESLFLKKYADAQLLSFRYEDRRLVSSTDQTMEVYNKIRQKEKGPFIICVDTSLSMEGRPEQIAKVLTLAILKRAVQDNRRAYLINFSIGIQTIDLYDIASSIDQVAAFLRMSFHGGTDATQAFAEALRMLETNDYEDADVLMISDFIMYKIEPKIMGEIRHWQQYKGTEFHSLALSNEANSEILRRFDTNWVYDPEKKGVIKELTRGLGEIVERP